MRRIACVAMLVVSCGDDSQSASGTSEGESSESSVGATESSSGSVADSTSSTSETNATTSSSSGIADSTDSSATFSVEYCGNGVLDPGEECDDDNNEDGDACSATCTNLFEIVWTVSFDGAQSGDDAWRGVVVRDDGEIVVAGSTAPPESVADVRLQSYSDDGVPGWGIGWGGPDGMHDAPSAMAAWEDDVAVVGVSGSEATGSDILVMRVDANTPALVWVQTIDGPGSGPAPDDDRDAASDVALDPHGNLVVAGYVAVDGEQRNAWIGELDADGGLAWEYAWDDGEGGDDAALALTVDADGSAHVIVLRLDEIAPVTILGVDDTGSPLGVEAVLADDVLYFDLVSLQDGATMLAGADAVGSVLSRFDDAWVEEWTEHGVDGFPLALTVDTSGHAYAAGRLYTPGAPDAWIGAFDDDGTRWWSDSYDNPVAHEDDEWDDVAVEGDGDVVVVGYETTVDEDANAIIRKYRSL
jgi:cysteine-rich repeat protein